MNTLIACCGLDCERCDARIATMNNDDKLREKTAKTWRELNGVEITKEMINCLGCRAEGVKTPFCDGLCPIRKCVKSKGFDTCGDCRAIENCTTLAMVTATNKNALNNLRDCSKRQK